MIYTSYFGNLKNIPKDIIPIAICGKSPEWYSGLEYKKLAPKYSFFMEWKKNHDNDYYIKCYNEQILANLNPKAVVLEMKRKCKKSLWNDFDIVLLCYEKPENFCHRHLVMEWLIQNGIDCKEWTGII